MGEFGRGNDVFSEAVADDQHQPVDVARKIRVNPGTDLVLT